MKRINLYDLAHVCVLLAAPGLAAWLLGQPLLFPSLGPSAFALVFEGRETRSWRVIAAHLIGALSGWLVYQVLAHGLSLAALPPVPSLAGLRIAASGVASIFLAVLVMQLLQTSHAPACATTLIVSLGLLPSLLDCALITAAVTGMVLTHRLVLRIRR